MKITATAYLLTGLLALAACSPKIEPKIDGASQESFDKSVKKMAATLPPDQARQLHEDIKTIVRNEVAQPGQLRFMDGKTAPALHRTALELIAARLEESTRGLRKHIEILERERAWTADEAASEAGIKVIKEPILRGALDASKGDGIVELALTIDNRTPEALKGFTYALDAVISGKKDELHDGKYLFEHSLSTAQSISIVIRNAGPTTAGETSALPARLVERAIAELKANPGSPMRTSIRLTGLVKKDGSLLDLRPQDSKRRLELLKAELDRELKAEASAAKSIP
jgi:hypothetical protein